jgi:hypothetical protein
VGCLAVPRPACAPGCDGVVSPGGRAPFPYVASLPTAPGLSAPRGLSGTRGYDVDPAGRDRSRLRAGACPAGRGLSAGWTSAALRGPSVP